jgi:drug/metabolite transporter (DMT)-like permease
VSGITQIVWGSGVAAVLLSPFALRADLGTAAANLPLLIPLGIITMGLSYLLFFLGLQRISAQTASITGLFEPVSGMLIGLLIFQEGLTLLGALGSLLVLAAIALISRPAR